MEIDLFTQKARLGNAERSLKTKETKKAREEVRIAANKIETLTTKLADLRRLEPKSRDNRIFSMVHAGVIIRREGQNLLTPMRYFCRPAGKPDFYDKKLPGLYNARRDNRERFWSDQFGHCHALMIVDNFYENVQFHVLEHREFQPGEEARNVVVQFTPDPPQPLLIACLWSHRTHPREPTVWGFAAITNEPPPDVAAAGHDGCIINIKPEHLTAWLTPAEHRSEELQTIV